MHTLPQVPIASKDNNIALGWAFLIDVSMFWSNGGNQCPAFGVGKKDNLHQQAPNPYVSSTNRS